MKALTRLFVIALIGIAPSTVPSAVVAQTRHDLTGEIELEEDVKGGDSYATSQELALSYFKKLSTLTEKLPTGGDETLPVLNEGALIYLNAIYLHCSNAAGTCPAVLDAILEGDIIDARKKKNAQCPTMTRFWQLWLRSDMEQRQKYSVKTGYLSVTEEFRRSVRPKYIKCVDTVKGEIAAPGSDADFFRSRYKSGSAQTQAIAKTIAIIEDVKSRIPNVLKAVGATSN